MAKKSVASVLEKLNKSYVESLIDVTEKETKRITLDSPSLNFIFGGGWPVNRVFEFYGPESGGKSALATYIAGQVQKHYERDMILYIDIERSFDKEYASKLGLNVDPEKFILVEPLTGEEGFDIARTLIQEFPIGLIIWDSHAATPSYSEIEDAFKATFGGTAKVFGVGLRTLNPYLSRYQTSMIVINQERARIGGFGQGPETTTTGGYAIKFYSSWRGRITRIDTIREKGKAVGIVSKVRNTKNKAGIPYREAILNLYFDSGFDSFNEYIQFFIDLNLIERRGAWYYNEEFNMKVQGKDGVATFMKENPDIFNSLKDRVNEIMKGDTPLDREEPEIENENDLDVEELPLNDN